MNSNINEIENYILLKKNENFSENSIKNWNYQLRKFERMINKSFKEVNERDILLFLNDSNSPNSKNLKLTLLRKFYRYLYKLSKYENLPDCLSRIELSKVKHNEINYRERVISNNEYELMILNCATPKERAILETFYNFGIRKSELLSMLYRDVSYNDGITKITVRESKTRTRDVIYHGRSKHLLAWKETLFPYKNVKDHYLFYSSIDHDKAYNRMSINLLISRVSKRAGIDRKVTPHDFRHTCITNHCKNGTPETHIKSIMGLEKNTEVLSVYDHNKTKAYEEYLMKKKTVNKPTYELLEEQKQTLEEKHQKEIDKLKRDQQKILEILKATLDENFELIEQKFDLEDELDSLEII